MLSERFLSKVAPTDSFLCWRWLAAKNSEGYGRYWHEGSLVQAHRHIWEAFNGPIPEGMVVDHTCHNEAAAKGMCQGGPTCPHRGCQNVNHMELKTKGENLVASPLTTSGIHARKTHCLNGHALEGGNLDPYKLRRGKRECRACKNARDRVYQKARRS